MKALPYVVHATFPPRRAEKCSCLSWILLAVIFFHPNRVIWAMAPVPGAGEMPAGTSLLEKHVDLSGYLRVRFDLFDNFDLNHGPTPSTGRHLFPLATSDPNGALTSANMRLRLEPTVRLPWGVEIHARVDVLDNLVLGSTPDALPVNSWSPTSGSSARAVPPEAGENNTADSIRVKRAWGQVLLPFGVLAAGRMGALINWGTGFFINSGNCLECDLGDVGDRISFSTPLLDHLVGFAFDFGAGGPTSSALGLYPQPFDLDRRDNVRSYALVIARYDLPAVVERYRRAGRTVLQYGMLASLRTQDMDVPAYYLTGDRSREYTQNDTLKRGLTAFAMDLWFGLRRGGLTLDLEAAMVLSEIENASLHPGTELLLAMIGRQFGGIARCHYHFHNKILAGIELGVASGDSAPGFGVRPLISQTSSLPGDLDGPQFHVPGDMTVDNFRFNPDYRIDMILWHQIIGTVTDAFYARPMVQWQPLDGVTLDGALIASLALEPTSTPSGKQPLGVELNLGVTYSMHYGFEARVQYGVLFPLAGLDNLRLGYDAEPAHALHALLAYTLN